MLPGLFNIPPASSSFGSSLESLVRAAKEQKRQFSKSGPEHVPEVFNLSHKPSGSGSTDAPLLRHEHMHTHLHYVTSPKHNDN